MRIRKTLALALLLMLFLAVAAFYNGLVLKRYEINTNKLKAGTSIRIVLISDLHNHIYGEKQEPLLSLIRRENPDLIALAGDIADDRVPIKGTELFLAGIQGIAPIYYVTGNHEFWSGDIKTIKASIEKYGVSILENHYEAVTIADSSIIIAGVDDPDVVLVDNTRDWEGELYTAFSPLENYPGFKVLLSHRPELIDLYLKTAFDLVLSGHAHGGQVRIPFLLNGLYAPNQGWFPQYAGGMYCYENLIHIVSRGVSFNPRLPRIFNPPEVVVIDIIGKQKQSRLQVQLTDIEWIFYCHSTGIYPSELYN
jgi:predicted MPP superfamily phosphohydrolase